MTTTRHSYGGAVLRGGGGERHTGKGKMLYRDYFAGKHFKGRGAVRRPWDSESSQPPHAPPNAQARAPLGVGETYKSNGHRKRHCFTKSGWICRSKRLRNDAGPTECGATRMCTALPTPRSLSGVLRSPPTRHLQEGQRRLQANTVLTRPISPTTRASLVLHGSPRLYTPIVTESFPNNGPRVPRGVSEVIQKSPSSSQTHAGLKTAKSSPVGPPSGGPILERRRWPTGSPVIG